MSKVKSQFFGNNKIDKLLERMIVQKEKKAQIKNSRNKNEYTLQMLKNIKEYYK